MDFSEINMQNEHIFKTFSILLDGKKIAKLMLITCHPLWFQQYIVTFAVVILLAKL